MQAGRRHADIFRAVQSTRYRLLPGLGCCVAGGWQFYASQDVGQVADLDLIRYPIKTQCLIEIRGILA